MSREHIKAQVGEQPIKQETAWDETVDGRNGVPVRRLTSSPTRGPDLRISIAQPFNDWFVWAMS